MRFSREFVTPRYQEKRRGIRMNSRVPVAIEWDGNPEGPARAETFTRIVSLYGCLVVVPHKLEVAQPLRVVNVTTQESHPGVVVWKGSERPEGWEVGIEFESLPADFWGIEW
jgi:hypothetical protein